MTRTLWGGLASGLAFSLTACGGGGGGGQPAQVQGRILLVTTGAPVSGASVNIGGATVLTGTNGTFLLNTNTKALQLQVTATGVNTLTQALPTLVATPQLNDLGDIFIGSDGYTAIAEGQIARASDLSPITGATVRLNGQVVVTGANGVFHFEGLPVNLGSTSDPVGLVIADTFENKPIVLDFPLGDSTGTPPAINDLGQILMAPSAGNIPGGPTNIRGVVDTPGVTDDSGTVVNLLLKSNRSVVTSVTTDANGSYGFFVIAGEYIVQTVRAPFAQIEREVTLPSPDTIRTVNITLVP